MTQMKFTRLLFFITILFTTLSCRQNTQRDVPVIGFVEAFEDATISQAKTGFLDALSRRGYSESDGTLKVLQRNAQGDIPMLNQIVNYFVSEEVDLIGSSTTLATIAAVQRNRDIPVFMSVSSMPEIIGLTDQQGRAPDNLFGVGEDLNYIDTAFSIIPDMLSKRITDRKIRIGMIYNQSEPQSVDAFKRIEDLASRLNVTLIALPLNSSAEAQLVTRSLLDRQIDAFFANPDNTVFAAFETILKNCSLADIPIFTSESGLVQRGALAAFGADIYAWGYQAGLQAARYLDARETKLQIEMVDKRVRVFNPTAAHKYGFEFSDNFQAIDTIN